jgi:hypothetical protein
MSELHTTRTLAKRLQRFGVTRAWLKSEAEAGRLPCLRVGRRLLFDADAVEAALLTRARETLTTEHGDAGSGDAPLQDNQPPITRSEVNMNPKMNNMIPSQPTPVAAYTTITDELIKDAESVLKKVNSADRDLLTIRRSLHVSTSAALKIWHELARRGVVPPLASGLSAAAAEIAAYIKLTSDYPRTAMPRLRGRQSTSRVQPPHYDADHERSYVQFIGLFADVLRELQNVAAELGAPWPEVVAQAKSSGHPATPASR